MTLVDLQRRKADLIRRMRTRRSGAGKKSLQRQIDNIDQQISDLSLVANATGNPNVDTNDNRFTELATRLKQEDAAAVAARKAETSRIAAEDAERKRGLSAGRRFAETIKTVPRDLKRVSGAIADEVVQEVRGVRDLGSAAIDQAKADFPAVKRGAGKFLDSTLETIEPVIPDPIEDAAVATYRFVGDAVDQFGVDTSPPTRAEIQQAELDRATANRNFNIDPIDTRGPAAVDDFGNVGELFPPARLEEGAEDFIDYRRLEDTLELENEENKKQGRIANALAGQVDVRQAEKIELERRAREIDLADAAKARADAARNARLDQEAAQLSIQNQQDTRDFNLELAEQRAKDAEEAFQKDKIITAAELAFSAAPKNFDNQNALGTILESSQNANTPEAILDSIAGKGINATLLYNKPNIENSAVDPGEAAELAFKSRFNQLDQRDTDAEELRLARLRDQQDAPFDPRLQYRADNFQFDPEAADRKVRLEQDTYDANLNGRNALFRDQAIKELGLQLEQQGEEPPFLGLNAVQQENLLRTRDDRQSEKELRQNDEKNREQIQFLSRQLSFLKGSEDLELYKQIEVQLRKRLKALDARQ